MEEKMDLFEFLKQHKLMLEISYDGCCGEFTVRLKDWFFAAQIDKGNSRELLVTPCTMGNGNTLRSALSNFLHEMYWKSEETKPVGYKLVRFPNDIPSEVLSEGCFILDHSKKIDLPREMTLPVSF